MTEEHKEDLNITYENRKNEPKFSTNISPDGVTTTVADSVKALLDGDTKLCTLLFFKKHVVPDVINKEIQMKEINSEAFLEVKVPFTIMNALWLILHSNIKTMNDMSWNGLIFGPARISIEGKKNNEQ